MMMHGAPKRSLATLHSHISWSRNALITCCYLTISQVNQLSCLHSMSQIAKVCPVMRSCMPIPPESLMWHTDLKGSFKNQVLQFQRKKLIKHSAPRKRAVPVHSSELCIEIHQIRRQRRTHHDFVFCRNKSQPELEMFCELTVSGTFVVLHLHTCACPCSPVPCKLGGKRFNSGGFATYQLAVTVWRNMRYLVVRRPCIKPL